MNTLPHVEAIMGTMFSGKSTELIRRANRLEIAGKKVQLFKSVVDDRYGLESIASHDGLKKTVYHVHGMDELEKHLNEDTEVVGIDEAQFLEGRVVRFCNKQAGQGKIVLVAFLYKDFKDHPFRFKDKRGSTSDLITIADHVTYLKAICTYLEGDRTCGNEASRVQRILASGEVAPAGAPLVQVGGKESYAPRCRQHYQFYK